MRHARRARAREGPRARVRDRSRGPGAGARRLRAGCARCSPTWSRNAIKFTAEGEVVVRASATPAADDAALVRVEVSDTGIGIARRGARAALRALRPGRRLDDAQVRRHRPRPGDLQAADRADGRRGSAPRASSGSGSTFWFELPVPRAQPGDGAPDERAVAGRPARPRRRRQRHQPQDPRAPAVLLADELRGRRRRAPRHGAAGVGRRRRHALRAGAARPAHARRRRLRAGARPSAPTPPCAARASCCSAPRAVAPAPPRRRRSTACSSSRCASRGSTRRSRRSSPASARAASARPWPPSAAPAARRDPGRARGRGHADQPGGGRAHARALRLRGAGRRERAPRRWRRCRGGPSPPC